ncbi:MAG: glycosyltransferase, partial [Gammaproteobacteria bacterium]|nr:glycosyltransferase [Gammaproteobacteria bacterium]
MPLQASLQVVSTAPETLALPEVTERAVARGKFLYVGDEKLWIKGVTYGTFRPDGDGNEYPPPRVVRQDFGMMVASGFNAVRTYTVPPHWLLDMAADYGLRVMVGLPWEQHVTFLEKRDTARSIEKRVRQSMRDCKGHPAVLCYTIGNEIPAAIVRWHGRRKIEDFLLRLYTAVKEEDPTALVTYVNFPTTEYLQLPFLDFVCFNVYLESKQTLQDYLARLHNLSGDRPVVMAEIGFDSQRNGEEAQALVLDWQIQTIFEEGCCGAFVFAWTDEWYRGGHDIEDWDFGLTRRDRSSKLALDAVSQALAQAPFPQNIRWPRISVVVCSCNGEPTIRDTMEALQKLEYPEYEVIVIDDGSTDRLAEIVSEYAVTLISTENRGLSNARNTGMEAASGEIIAYTDDDAYPDPHWLHYLALTFLRSDYVGVGGPNLAPPGDGWAADCVANAPGGPVHVLLCDRVAEHIPGCNMAFKKEALMAIGGFDPRYRAAGDDVDVCWRLQEQGWIIGFSPAAIVWHHRRNSLRAFWRQQLGYGKAEALLEEKWPQK